MPSHAFCSHAPGVRSEHVSVVIHYVNMAFHLEQVDTCLNFNLSNTYIAQLT